MYMPRATISEVIFQVVEIIIGNEQIVSQEEKEIRQYVPIKDSLCSQELDFGNEQSILDLD